MIAVPTLHPAFLLRSANDEGGQAKFKATVEHDFKRAVEYLRRKPEWDERVIWEQDEKGRYKNLFPTVVEVADFLRRSRGKLAAIDVETTGEEVLDCQLLCVGLACEDGRAINIPFLRQGGHAYWSEAEEVEVWRLLRRYLGDAKSPKVFHNGSFDTVVLWANDMPVEGWDEDTMQAHHVADSELPHSLAYCGSIFTEVPYYKDEVKGAARWLDLDDVTLRSYNLRDVLVTIRVLPAMLRELRRWQLEHLYREEIRLCKRMAKATIRGVLIDRERRKWLSTLLQIQREEALGALRSMAGHPEFNPGSVARQLRWFLFDHLGFPVVKRTDKGNPSTDKDAMVLLALHAREGAQTDALRQLVKWRKSDKMINTWAGVYDPAYDTFDGGLHVLGDGRVHATWKNLTVTGRLASSPNMQNFNKLAKMLCTVPDGSKWVGVDLSQAELRMMAYVSGDKDLLYMYERGIDVHTVNCTLLFQCRNPGENTNPATEAFLDELCPRVLGMSYADLPSLRLAQWGSARVLAKNFVFGDNYGAMAETLFDVLRAKRDPETDEALFPDLELGTVEACKIMWEQIHPSIPGWWAKNILEIETQGHYRCPISGRIHWFRAGFERNRMLNAPIQTGVASHMNRLNVIGERLEDTCGEESVIVVQVHDMIGTETTDPWVDFTKDVLREELSKPFDLPGYKGCVLPPDKPKAARYLDEV